MYVCVCVCRCCTTSCSTCLWKEIVRLFPLSAEVHCIAGLAVGVRSPAALPCPRVVIDVQLFTYLAAWLFVSLSSCDLLSSTL